MASPYNTILFGHKKKWSSDPHYNMSDHWKYDTKWQKSGLKGHTVCAFICMKCPEQANAQT